MVFTLRMKQGPVPSFVSGSESRPTVEPQAGWLGLLKVETLAQMTPKMHYVNCFSIARRLRVEKFCFHYKENRSNAHR